MTIKNHLNKLNSLQQRILTAVVAIPIGLGAIWLGFPFFDILALLILVCMIREWSKMTMETDYSPMGYGFLISILSYMYLDISPTRYFHMICAFTIIGVLNHLYQKKSRFRDFLFYGIGSLYITWSIYILIYIMSEGLQFFFMWVLIIVLSSDTGAFFAGKFIGGPKLAPKISPGKTWSGFLGGMIMAAVMGLLTASYLQNMYLETTQIIGASLFLSLMSHTGDLLESMVKRYYHVKDSGSLLPGHGGVLDRFDSMLLVSFASIILLFTGF